PAPLPPVQQATVHLNTGDYVADVFLSGTKVRLGDTRTDLLLHPGTYELELRSPVLMEQTEKVTVASGERLVLPVTLRPRPSKGAFPKKEHGEGEVGGQTARL